MDLGDVTYTTFSDRIGERFTLTAGEITLDSGTRYEAVFA